MKTLIKFTFTEENPMSNPIFSVRHVPEYDGLGELESYHFLQFKCAACYVVFSE